MRTSWILVLAVVFASGGVSGFFVGRSQAVRRPGELPTREEVLEAFVREVGLDSEQKKVFEQIFNMNHPRFVAIKSRVEPELAAVRSDVRAQLRATLRDDQQKARFDAYCNLRDRQRDESMR